MFDKSKEWFAYSREIEILDPVFSASSEKGMQMVMETVVEEVEEFGSSFGAGTLLMKALERAGEDEEALDLYGYLRDYTASMFSSLPDLPRSPFSWTQEPNPALDDFSDVALDITWDVWKTPKIHRRMNLVHLLHDVAISRPDALLPRVVDSAVSNDADIQSQAALVLHSVAQTNSDLLEPYADDLINSLPIEHVVVDHHISEAVEKTGRNVPRSKLSKQSSRIVIQGVLPSDEWKNVIWPRIVPQPMAGRIVEAGRVLGWKERETLYRIEQKASSADFDFEYAREMHDDEISAYHSNVGESIIPYISYPARRILDIASRLFADNCGKPRHREEILALLRAYDPALPWKDWNGVPEDLKPKQWEESRDETGRSFQKTEIEQEWVTVYEEYFLDREDHWRKGFKFPCLLSEETADAVNLHRAPDPGNYLLELSGDQPTLTVQEAQQSAKQTADNYSRSSIRPLVGIHPGEWWFAQRNSTVVLAPDLIKQFDLDYNSGQSLDMVDQDGNLVVRLRYWQDGVRAKQGKYEPVGRGTRLDVAASLLQRLREEKELHLFTRSLTQQKNEQGRQHGQRVKLELIV